MTCLQHRGLPQRSAGRGWTEYNDVSPAPGAPTAICRREVGRDEAAGDGVSGETPGTQQAGTWVLSHPLCSVKQKCTQTERVLTYTLTKYSYELIIFLHGLMVYFYRMMIHPFSDSVVT